ncbi:nuclear transport factor 2 family protein [Nocardia vinacea]|uniref:nuclear transport factor 2 family protein n=1 Tax=Nocardia vinacea TaxID=96468 RepID=UPI0002E2F672|nr:nuclear transport factor 2 family protein [Nocardia vinacea]
MTITSRRTFLTAVAATATGGALAYTSAAPASATPFRPQHDSPADDLQVIANKALVGYVFDQLFNRGNLSVVDQYVQPDLIEHDPTRTNGAAALKEFVQSQRAAYPEASVIMHRTLGEGNLVTIHSHFVPVPGTSGNATIDIFRLERGKIVEHWDVIQDVPATTASGNDMFSTLSAPLWEQPDPCAPTAKNKEIALAMFTGVFVDRDLTAFDRHVADPYYQHSPTAPNGIEFPKQLLAQAFTSPYFNVSIKRVIADGDYVATHAHYHFADDRGMAICDLYRVREGKVVEHWDIVQNVPATSSNDNAMF